MRLAASLALVAMLLAGCSSSPAAAPEPTRAQAREPLSEQEALACINADMTRVLSPASSSPLPMWDVVSARVREYSRQILPSPWPSLTPEQMLTASTEFVQRFGGDAEMALLCRTRILPAVAELP